MQNMDFLGEGFWGIDINIYNGIKKIYFVCLVGLFETSKYISEYPDDFIAWHIMLIKKTPIMCSFLISDMCIFDPEIFNIYIYMNPDVKHILDIEF